MLLFIKKRKEQKGFTLIEVMLVVAMIAMLAGMTIPITFGSLKKQSVEEESSKLLSVLRQTQAKSMKGRGDSPWGVYFTPESYTVFKGNSYEERESLYDEVFEISPGMSVAGAPEIVFDYEGVPRIKGLVGHWTMNEGEGGVAHDLSGNDNHGSLVNGPTWADGKVGGALDFDGENDYVDIGFSEDFLATNGIAVSAWINSKSFDPFNDSHYVIISKRNDVYDLDYELLYHPNDKFQFRTYYGGSFIASGSYELETEKWYHAVGMYNGSQLILYVDGSLVSSNNIGGIGTNANSNLSIGSFGHQHEIGVFNGQISDVRIYNRALTEDEIRLMYESGLDGVDDNIIELSGGGESAKINIGRQGRIEIVR